MIGAGSSGTREKILRSAAKLFGGRGLSTPSLRSIVSEAGVNLAAIHYYFGTRQALLESLIERGVKFLHEKQTAFLGELEESFLGEEIPVGEIVRSYIAPYMDLWSRERDLVQVLVRVPFEGEEELKRFLIKRHEKIMNRFVSLLQESYPDLSFGELAWRFSLIDGMLAQVFLAGPGMLPGPFSSAPHQKQVELILEALSRFWVRGAAGKSQ